MALVGEAGFLCDQGEGLAGLAQQALSALEPALNDIALRPNSGRPLEGAAEVIGAQTGQCGRLLPFCSIWRAAPCLTLLLGKAPYVGAFMAD